MSRWVFLALIAVVLAALMVFAVAQSRHAKLRAEMIIMRARLDELERHSPACRCGVAPKRNDAELKPKIGDFPPWHGKGTRDERDLRAPQPLPGDAHRR